MSSDKSIFIDNDKMRKNKPLIDKKCISAIEPPEICFLVGPDEPRI